MQTSNGNHNLSDIEVIKGIENGSIKYVTVVFPCNSSSVCAKRYDGDYFKSNVLEGKVRVNELLNILNYKHSEAYNEYINKTIGYDDVFYTVDRNSFRKMPWLDNSYVMCMGEMLDYFKKPNLVYCRNLLKNCLNRLMEEKGITAKGASELEFYLLKNTNRDIVFQYPKVEMNENLLSDNYDCELFSLNTLDYVEKVTKKMKDCIRKLGIELEGLFCEAGAGQLELNMKYCDLFENSDNHILAKHAIKQIASSEGFGISFMAKTTEKCSGSSYHNHISLYDKDNRNIFAPKDESDSVYLEHKGKRIACSKTLIHFIGGLNKYVKECFYIIAPTINSYKRFCKGQSVALFTNTWGYGNKMVANRICGEGDSVHLEFRLCGPDANPYLVNSLLITAGMKGVEEKIEPIAICKGNIEETIRGDFDPVPKCITESLKLFKNSKFAQEVFGKELHDCLYNIGKSEIEDFNKEITSWELKRYLENV